MHFNQDELLDISEKIRNSLTSGKGVTLADYVNLANSKKGDEIGLLYLWVLKKHPSMRQYFPDEVFSILSAKTGRHFYTEEDNNFIKENACNGIRSLVSRLNVPPASAYKQARFLGVKVPRSDYVPYTVDEEKRILGEDLSLTDSLIGEKLGGRSARSVQIKRLNAGIRKREIIHWEDFPDKEKYLIRNFGKKSYDEIAQVLGLRYYQVKTKVERLKAEGRLKRN